jgi:hypothetical protein
MKKKVAIGALVMVTKNINLGKKRLAQWHNECFPLLNTPTIK